MASTLRDLTELIRPHVQALELSVLNQDEKAAAVINMYEAAKKTPSADEQRIYMDMCERALREWRQSLQ